MLFRSQEMDQRLCPAPEGKAGYVSTYLCEKAGLKLNIQETKIMASGSITSWQIHIYIHVHVCPCAHVSAYVHVSMCACMSMCAYESMFAYMSMRACMLVHVCMCVHVCACQCACTCLWARMLVHVLHFPRGSVGGSSAEGPHFYLLLYNTTHERLKKEGAQESIPRDP